MATDTPEEISFVVLDGQITVIRIDHLRRRQKAWSLAQGRWVAADVVEALFKGRVVPRESVGELPALPDWP